jgi:cyclohexanone monooxygenase
MPYAGGLARYRRICDDVAARGYEGFILDRASPNVGFAPPQAAAATPGV